MKVMEALWKSKKDYQSCATQVCRECGAARMDEGHIKDMKEERGKGRKGEEGRPGYNARCHRTAEARYMCRDMEQRDGE